MSSGLRCVWLDCLVLCGCYESRPSCSFASWIWIWHSSSEQLWWKFYKMCNDFQAISLSPNQEVSGCKNSNFTSCSCFVKLNLLRRKLSSFGKTARPRPSHRQNLSSSTTRQWFNQSQDTFYKVFLFTFCPVLLDCRFLVHFVDTTLYWSSFSIGLEKWFFQRVVYFFQGEAKRL